MPEIVGKAALLCDPYDSEDIAQKIGKVLKDKDLQKKLNREGLKQAKKYSWKEAAQELKKVFRRQI